MAETEITETFTVDVMALGGVREEITLEVTFVVDESMHGIRTLSEQERQISNLVRHVLMERAQVLRSERHA